MTRCPKCKTPTTRVEYEGANVRICGECGGYWVTQLALKAIANRRDVQFSEAVKQRFIELADASNSTETLVCMTCGKHMIKERFKDWDDIIVDHCPKCRGIWLDPGELEKIQIYWEYFQDHPEKSNLDAIARRELLLNHMQQQTRDIKEAAQDAHNIARRRGFVPRETFSSVMRTLFGGGSAG
ncbi:MAG: zf-TFIIB domain-containing protein [Phycisphaerae bacterium]|nr:zf-TFIIB domain-containing protein [Phycisphaerae bacterium]